MLATVISATAAAGEMPGRAVADGGLKALGMDHGNPTEAQVVLLRRAPDVRSGSAGRGGRRIRVLPAHVDPTVALHERMHLVRGDDVLDSWPVDLRGW